MTTNSLSILGVEVSGFESIEQLISTNILTNTEEQIIPGVAVAINPEKIMMAHDTPNIKQLLERASLRYPDGIGVVYVMRKVLKREINRIPGCDLWQRLMLASVAQKIPVYLVGANEQVITDTKAKLEQQGVNIVGYQNGYFSEQQQADVIENIRLSGAKIVTVAMGSPKQELFIFNCQKAYPNAFYMGVGGTYDVFVGNVQRAPEIWQKLHLEWAYRLVKQPARIFRQKNLLRYLLFYISGKLVN